MATSLTHTYVYKGEESKSYLAKALTGGETLSIDGININEKVKYQWRPRIMSTGNLIASGGTGAFDFSASNAITITGQLFEPKKWKVNIEIPTNEFYDMPDSATMAAGQHNEDVPAEFQKALTENVVAKVAQEIELAIWSGKTSIGLTGIIASAHGSVLSAATPTTITASNVVAELYKGKNKLPAGVRKKGNKNLVYAVSYEIADFYRQALSAQGNNTSQPDQALTIHGVELVACAGLSANRYFLFERANLGVATDLESDFNEVKVIDMRETTMDDKFRFGMKGTLDVKFIQPTEAVYYNG